MGAYKYMSEVWRKKQSDVLRYLLRVRCWYFRQLSAVHRAPRPTRPDKARKLGYKAKQGMIEPSNFEASEFSYYLNILKFLLAMGFNSWTCNLTLGDNVFCGIISSVEISLFKIVSS